MKKLSLLVSLVLAFALSVWAQTPSPNDTQSGSNSSAASGAQSGAGTMSSQPSTASQTQGSMGTAEPGKMGKEHKLKGCLESQSGSYELREESGKEIALTGSSDLSQYANHEVVIHGDWANAGANSTSSTSDMSKADEKQFTVSKVDSVADTCKSSKNEKGNANPPSQQ
jgi:hypothetical protein